MYWESGILFRLSRDASARSDEYITRSQPRVGQERPTHRRVLVDDHTEVDDRDHPARQTGAPVGGGQRWAGSARRHVGRRIRPLSHQDGCQGRRLLPCRYSLRDRRGDFFTHLLCN